MWFPPIEQMAGANEASAFLVLSWEEMFEASTPDTYQPRLSNPASLVDELLAAADRAIEDERWEKHVSILKHELRSTVDREADLLEELPTYHWALGHLSEQSTKHQEIAALARTLHDHQEKYRQRAIHRLRSAAEELSSDTKKKSSASQALSRLGTIATQSGQDPGYFRALFTPDNLSDSPKRIAEIAVSSIKLRSSSFKCLLAVRGEVSAVQQIARKAGFRLVSQNDLPSDPNGSVFVQSAASAIFLQIEEQADFAVQAIRRASRKLRQAADVYNFFKNALDLNIVSTALAVDSSKRPTIVDLGEEAFRHIKPRKNAVDLTQKILDVAPNRLTDRVLNALEHFSLAHVGASQKVQLVNLWSAIECLAGAGGGNSVIATVCDVVSPIVVWRRTEKILRYIAKSLHEFRSNGASGSLGPGFPDTDKSVSPECLLLALARPKNHPDILGLLGFCSAHPLLRNRVYTLWSTFSEPQRLLADLRLSFDRSTYNLWRIYRARNLIVHEGVDVEHVPILLNQLRYFFSTTMSRILHGMSLNEKWSVEESAAHWKARTGYLLETLQRNSSRLRVTDFFPVPKRRATSQPWLPESDAKRTSNDYKDHSSDKAPSRDTIGPQLITDDS